MVEPNDSDAVLDRLSPGQRPDERAIGFQRWRSLLFLHWQVPEEELQIEDDVPAKDKNKGSLATSKEAVTETVKINKVNI